MSEKRLTMSVLQQMDPTAFEQFVAALWARKGYNTWVTKQSSDGGIDVKAKRGAEKYIIQAKRYGSKTSVSGPEVQQYAGLLAEYPDYQVIIVTTNDFTTPAKERATRTGVQLCDGRQLVKMIHEYEAYDIVEKNSQVTLLSSKPDKSKLAKLARVLERTWGETKEKRSKLRSARDVITAGLLFVTLALYWVVMPFNLFNGFVFFVYMIFCIEIGRAHV